MESYDALVIEPDLDSRMRLKAAMTSVPAFKQNFQVGKIKEGQQKIDTSSKAIDVVFVSYRFTEEEVNEFLQYAKAAPITQDAAFILIKKSQDQQSTSIASSVLAGADGLLFEPFSVDQLMEITRIASKVKKERSSAREEGALKFLLSDVINQIDQVAYLKACEYETGTSMKKLKEMCGVFASLSPESKEIYNRIVIEAFENAHIPKMVFQRKKYTGASSRVQKRMEKKTLGALGITPEGETK
jgi:response regulator RpfG family c-di-GMP phosphodiesterase